MKKEAIISLLQSEDVKNNLLAIEFLLLMFENIEDAAVFLMKHSRKKNWYHADGSWRQTTYAIGNYDITVHVQKDHYSIDANGTTTTTATYYYNITEPFNPKMANQAMMVSSDERFLSKKSQSNNVNLLPFFVRVIELNRQ